MKRYTEKERPLPPDAPAQCYDCGFPYGNPAWIEAVVPDEIWAIINPTYYQGAGLLCIQCIANRCIEAGLEDVPVKLTAGPLILQR